MPAKNIQDRRKIISLIITLILTIFIFSMSLLSGADSVEISSSLSVSFKKLIDMVFANNNITLETLHLVVRKGAHVFEYLLLGISYFFTAKYWKLSILKVSIIGLLTTVADELLQNIPVDRTASAIDIFVYDFGGFILGFGIMLLFLNRKSKLEIKQALTLLQNQEISAKKAYKSIYRKDELIKFTNKAHFVKLKIIVPDEKGVNVFLRILFFLPIPLLLVKIAFPFIKIENTDMPFSKTELLQMITSKNISIVVNASTKEKVIIKTI